MSREPDAKRRRLQVMLAAGESDWALLEEAARLAAGLQAELLGLLLENAELVEAAGLPMTSLMPASGAGPGALTADMMQQALRIWSASTRERLGQAAERWQVPCSVRAMAEYTATDPGTNHAVETITFFTESVMRPGGLSLEQVLAEHASGPVVVMRRPIPAGAPMVVLFEGDARVLAMAETLARIYRSPLMILPVGADPQTSAARAEQALQLRRSGGLAADVLVLGPETLENLGNRLRQLQASALALARGSDLLARDDLIGRTAGALLILV